MRNYLAIGLLIGCIFAAPIAYSQLPPSAGGSGITQLTGDCTAGPGSGSVAANCSKTGGVAFAPSATTDTTNATNIGSGTLGAGRLPNPSASTLGGVQSLTGTAKNFMTGINTSGVPQQSQPSTTTLSDVVSAGSWTPVDSSGASLIFTTVSATYNKIGNMVFASFQLTFPATANASQAVIGGLPVTIPNSGFAHIPSHCNMTAAGFTPVGTLGIGGTAIFMGNNANGGSSITNANLSGVTLACLVTYPAS